MRIAVIPARAGSKRIPNKNIRNFQGKPMLQMTIEKILNFGFFDYVYVSTEDTSISKIALQCGSKILERDSSLSTDFTTTLDVMHDAVRQLEEIYLGKIEIVTCVYPATPFLDLHHLTQASKLLELDGKGYVFAARNQSAELGRSFFFNKNDELEILFPSQENLRTQDVPRIYSDAGLFYMGKVSTWSCRTPIFSPESKFVEIGKYESIDIDSEEDWNFAEELAALRAGRDSK